MTCKEFDELLDLLMDDALTEDQRRSVTAHAQACPECAGKLRSTMQLKALLSEMEPEAAIPLQAQAAWRGAVREEAARQSRRRRLRWIGTAAAAVVVLAGAGLALGLRGAPKRDVASTQFAAIEMAQESAVGAESAEESAAFEATEGAIVETDGAGERAAGTAKEAALPEARYENAIEAAPKQIKSDAEPAPMEPEAAGEANEVEIAQEEVGMTLGEAPATEYAMEESAWDGEEADEAALESEEAELLTFEPEMCAALAQRAPACELALRVDDVEKIRERICDLVEEYEGKADVQTLQDGDANLFVELPAENAADFLNAVIPMDASGTPPELPELSAEGTELIMLTLKKN